MAGYSPKGLDAGGTITVRRMVGVFGTVTARLQDHRRAMGRPPQSATSAAEGATHPIFVSDRLSGCGIIAA